MSALSDHVAALLADRGVYGKFLANARQLVPTSIHGITADDVVQEATLYVWKRALEHPEMFEGKPDHQIVGLAYQRISGYAIDQIRRHKSGAAKTALAVGVEKTACDPFDDLCDQMSDPPDIALSAMRAVFPLVEQMFEFQIGLSRFITMVKRRVERDRVSLDGDPEAVRQKLLELLATTLPTWRLAPATKAKPPVNRQALFRLEVMLIDGQPINEASTGLPIGDIVRGLDHIWRAAARMVRRGAPPDATPARALVLAGVTPSTDAARRLLDIYAPGRS
ncbi:MAG: hypothetical protein LBG60_15700 [Bifidobacteriaceae bacterium]|jgi:hypothetical protein|nr:hypothetical protein [Bifidobacteriaceae bacterium]